MSIAFSGAQERIPQTQFSIYPNLDIQPLRTSLVKGACRDLTDWIGAIGSDTLELEHREFIGIQPESVASTFVPNKALAKGRLNNHHGLKFGQLILRSTRDQDMPTLVAVKPHDSDGELAYEWVIHEALNSLSDDQQSYVPLGMWRDAAGNPQLVTLYEHSVQSFDNLFWAQGRKARQTTDEQLVRGYQLVFFTLGIGHGAGLAQADASVRNFARDSKRVRFNDPEGIELIKRVNGTVLANDKETKRMVRRDMLRVLASSLERWNSTDEPIMLNKLTRLILDDTVRDGIYRHYLGGINVGNKRSGLTARPNLYPDFATFIQATHHSIEFEKHRMADNSQSA